MERLPLCSPRLIIHVSDCDDFIESNLCVFYLIQGGNNGSAAILVARERLRPVKLGTKDFF